MYPQLIGEPNFVLIGVSAVFGLLMIIMVYYIFVSNNMKYNDENRGSYQSRGSLKSSPSPTLQPSQLSLSPSPLSPQGQESSKRMLSNSPVPINTGGQYVPPKAQPQATLSNPKQNQVFNIKQNVYTLDDAPGVCGALGADVASINQLIDAHKQGADWCNVGWTKDGLAAFPIQYSTWKTLQDNEPNKRNICGSPGINLVRNDPNLLYGVNCYGVKPEPKGNEKVKQSVVSDKQTALNAKIAEFQKNINAIGVVPFNADSWSA